MSTNNPLNLLLNRGAGAQQEAVEGPAFSITKVLATVATVLTPLITVIVAQLDQVAFDEGHIVVLIVSLLAFLAVGSTADVLARAFAASAKTRADAARHVADQATVAARLAKEATVEAAQLHRDAGSPVELLPFDPPLSVRVKHPDVDPDASVLGLARLGDVPTYLCRVGDDVTWLPHAEIVFPGQRLPHPR